jgi:hypothetical protein
LSAFSDLFPRLTNPPISFLPADHDIKQKASKSGTYLVGQRDGTKLAPDPGIPVHDRRRTNGAKTQGERDLAIYGLVAFDCFFCNSDHLKQPGEHAAQDSMQDLHFITEGLSRASAPKQNG